MRNFMIIFKNSMNYTKIRNVKENVNNIDQSSILQIFNHLILMTRSTSTSRNCVIVSREHGERIRRSLVEGSALDHNYKICSKDDTLIFPISHAITNSAIEHIIGPAVKFTVKVCDVEPSEKNASGNYRDYLQQLPKDAIEQLPSSFDVIGNICTIKLPDQIDNYGSKIAKALMQAHSSIHGVFQDMGVTGEYRIRNLKHLGGERGTATIHREFGIQLHVDISKVYFTPRLAEERDRISKLVQNRCKQSEINNPKILDMFAGCGPFSIRLGRDIPQASIFANDLNLEATDLLKKNMALNKVENITIFNQNAKDLATFISYGSTFDHIIMNLPHSSMDFLQKTLPFVAAGMIHLYTITSKDDLKELQNTIQTMIIDQNLRLMQIDTLELKGYSPQENVYVHDLAISGK
jgi:tRNA (guanine37-N1)-methyltransferase